MEVDQRESLLTSILLSSWTPPRSLPGLPLSSGLLLACYNCSNNSSKTTSVAWIWQPLKKHAVSQERCLWVSSSRLRGEGRQPPGLCALQAREAHQLRWLLAKGHLQDHSKSEPGPSFLVLCRQTWPYTESNKVGIGDGQFRAGFKMYLLHCVVSCSLA